MIQVLNLVKKYGEKTVINNISFEMKKGEICGYLGPNGAGKTTTVKMLIGLVGITSGKIYMNNLDVEKYPDMVKRRIGYVPESGFLYDPLSPLEYLTFIGRMHDMDDKLTEKRIHLFAELLDLKNFLDKSMVTFSKGMKQKVLIISALIHMPEVIILDEPLDGLDAGSMILFKELIKSLAKQNVTVFYCSHLLDVVEKMCDNIILLDEGNIIISGKIDEVRHKMNEDHLEKIYDKLIIKEDQKMKVERFIEEIGKDF